MIFESIIPSFDYIVFLFMIISGFGMCCGYYEKVKNKQLDTNEFYERRYKKELPFYGLLIILDILIERNLESIYEGILELTLLFGLLPNNSLGVIGVSWTLGVIFVFYLIFPYFCFLLYNKRRGWIALVVSILITILCQVYFMSNKFVVDGYVYRHSFLYCLPFFIIGGLIYLYRNEVRKVWENKYVILCFITVILTVLYFVFPNDVLGFDIVAYKCMLIFASWLMVAIAKRNWILSNSFTSFVGGISMEIYLAHMICFRVVEKISLGRYFGKGYVAYISTTAVVFAILIVGIVCYRKIQNFFLKKVVKKEL